MHTVFTTISTPGNPAFRIENADGDELHSDSVVLDAADTQESAEDFASANALKTCTDMGLKKVVLYSGEDSSTIMVHTISGWVAVAREVPKDVEEAIVEQDSALEASVNSARLVEDAPVAQLDRAQPSGG